MHPDIVHVPRVFRFFQRTGPPRIAPRGYLFMHVDKNEYALPATSWFQFTSAFTTLARSVAQSLLKLFESIRIRVGQVEAIFCLIIRDTVTSYTVVETLIAVSSSS
ncbi:hypothetical protein DL98DRAFT_656136 [Cadophora sp. DSE1049]|nr:hypothetical protein DL98DRAFT_656136 [Cadophora sp. DSE1049]